MRVLLLANPSSGSSNPEDLDAVERELTALGDVERLAPDSLDTFDEEVRAAAGGAELVVVAGGDGTFNLAVNALRDDLERVQMGLVPMGTGNDLTRTLGVPSKPVDAARSLATGRERSIDVWRARSPGVDRLFVNACMGGLPVAVDEGVDDDLKRRLGPVAFVIAGAKEAAELTRYEVEMGGVSVSDCIAAGVGNGRTCGGGVRVWPEADPSDGLLDGCLLGASGVGDVAKLAATVRSGRHTGLDAVESLRAGRIEVTSEPEMEFNLDGELVGLRTPVTFEPAGRMRVRGPALITGE